MVADSTKKFAAARKEKDLEEEESGSCVLEEDVAFVDEDGVYEE